MVNLRVAVGAVASWFGRGGPTICGFSGGWPSGRGLGGRDPGGHIW